MRMIVVPRIGGPEVLTMVDVERPVPGPDQVLVKLRYATITFGDVYLREGTYRGGAPLKESEAPLRIGGEGAGMVAAVGVNVKHVKEGDTVVYCEQIGSYAEYAAVPGWRVVKVPDGIALQDAASILSIGGTAHYLAHDTAELGPNMTCLIHAAAGGVGHVLMQFARMLGTQVLATVSTKEKAEFVRQLGANRAIVYNDEDFLEVVKGWGDGKGLDVVFDSVGKATIKKSIQAVRHRGLCVLYGNSSGLVESISPMELSATGSIYFTRPRFAHHMRSREEMVKRADDIFAAMRDGRLKFALARIFPLAQASEAHALLQSRATIGKILLSIE
jgi:NADPH2:quinone reductase